MELYFSNSVGTLHNVQFGSCVYLLMHLYPYRLEIRPCIQVCVKPDVSRTMKRFFTFKLNSTYPRQISHLEIGCTMIFANSTYHYLHGQRMIMSCCTYKTRRYQLYSYREIMQLNKCNCRQVTWGTVSLQHCGYDIITFYW